jgi:hypothetical protein
MSSEIARHYGKTGLLDRILTALGQAGKDVDHLTIDDLAPVDEFHSRRRLATRELAAMLAPSAGEHVIDVGSGLGDRHATWRQPMAARSAASVLRRNLSRCRGL